MSLPQTSVSMVDKSVEESLRFKPAFAVAGLPLRFMRGSWSASTICTYDVNQVYVRRLPETSHVQPLTAPAAASRLDATASTRGYDTRNVCTTVPVTFTFGTVSESQSFSNNYLYRGEQFDNDLGLYYLRARYYNPSTGRFVSMDPENGVVTDPKTLHKYEYAGGDPVNLADPTGRNVAAPTMPRPIGASEYAMLVGLISLQAAISLPQVQKAISCQLNKASDLLYGVSQDMTQPVQEIEFGQCSAKVGKCKRCYPVDKGGWGYRIDWNQQRSHDFWLSKIFVPPFIPHFHLYLMSQSPFPDCTCFWDKVDGGLGGFVPPGPPPDAVPMLPAWGGGPEWF